jgi:hypothetical protein
MTTLITANVFATTIVRTRPSTTIKWFDDALFDTTGEYIDSSFNNTINTVSIMVSSDNLTRTIIRASEEKSTLESYISSLSDPNSVYYGITAYNNAKGITVSISDIIEIPNPDPDSISTVRPVML